MHRVLGIENHVLLISTRHLKISSMTKNEVNYVRTQKVCDRFNKQQVRLYMTDGYIT